MNSTAAIERIRTDAIEPGQRFAVAAIERAARVRARDNEVAVRWVLAHQGVPRNEKADEYARPAADGAEPSDAVPDDYRWEASLSHMA